MLLPPEKAKSIYDNLETSKQDIQPQDAEPEHFYAWNTPDQVQKWGEGELILIGAIRVSWKDKGAWLKTSTQRCWAWTIGGSFACEDLIDDPAGARELVRKYLQVHPSIRRDITL